MTALDPFAVWCPTCGARDGEQCKSVQAGITQRAAHKQRVTAARRRREGGGSPGLTRKTPMKRVVVMRDDKRTPTDAPKKSRKKRGARGKDGFSQGVKNQVRARSDGWCEARIDGVCVPELHEYQHVHHIWERGAGGPDTIANALGVCWQSHDWIHSSEGSTRAVVLRVLGRSAYLERVGG